MFIHLGGSFDIINGIYQDINLEWAGHILPGIQWVST